MSGVSHPHAFCVQPAVAEGVVAGHLPRWWCRGRGSSGAGGPGGGLDQPAVERTGLLAGGVRCLREE
jgi:hypothetical protein